MMKYFFDLIICLQIIIIQILFSYSFLSYLYPSFLSIKNIFFNFSLTTSKTATAIKTSKKVNCFIIRRLISSNKLVLYMANILIKRIYTKINFISKNLK